MIKDGREMRDGKKEKRGKVDEREGCSRKRKEKGWGGGVSRRVKRG